MDTFMAKTFEVTFVTFMFNGPQITNEDLRCAKVPTEKTVL